ncbi:uncharacterized protein LOC124390865 [Silurus meridionalis]|uniref:Uncharacterized protein n=1 Tax=Silurus meridionalis TaxID=175797 RepID=A0A8T0BBN9_SILME|nr:uncharacterized protein LOC124390865 [Silurus meridionalis]KAF7703157.1 hypothetical protein HF521_022164 [Silurus meridionalis]
MYQLLNKCLALLFFYICFVCVSVVSDDVIHAGTAGMNFTVIFTLKGTIDKKQVYLYRNNTKIYTFTPTNSCTLSDNHTVPTSCIHHVPGGKISLHFINLIHSGVYHLAALMPNLTLVKSNKVNLTVYPAEYITTYTIVTAPSLNNTSCERDRLESKPSILIFVSLPVVIVILVIVLLSLFYWSYKRKTEKTTAVNATSAPQVIPDVTCVEYCVLEFPNPAGEKVRSTEERVEYSPIVFPPRKTMAQGNQIKPMTQQNQAKMTTLQSHRETDKVPDKPNTSKPKPKQKYPKKKITPNHTVSSSKV